MSKGVVTLALVPSRFFGVRGRGMWFEGSIMDDFDEIVEQLTCEAMFK